MKIFYEHYFIAYYAEWLIHATVFSVVFQTDNNTGKYCIVDQIWLS